MKKLGKVLLTLVIIVVVTICWIQASRYDADEFAYSCLETPIEQVAITQHDEYISYQVKDSEVAIIFYPGGLVDYRSYCPLARLLATQGISVFIMKMPLDLAVLQPEAADLILENSAYSYDWYLAGHSLGGAMACQYLEKHQELKGLILLASYSNVDLSEQNIEVLSIYGSKDQVLNQKKYQQYKHYLPNVTEKVIEGGNHCNFGSYGMQKGDGIADISCQQQLQITVETITEFVLQKTFNSIFLYYNIGVLI